jgi:hypothetical protein
MSLQQRQRVGRPADVGLGRPQQRRPVSNCRPGANVIKQYRGKLPW